MILLAVDPGNTESAWALYDSTAPRLIAFGKHVNEEVLEVVRSGGSCSVEPTDFAVEMIASYGMAVGREVFETCVWVGRFIEAWRISRPDAKAYRQVYRRDVKLHLCHDSRAKDGNVRQALIDMFGPGKERAVGTKKRPGPLYGVSADVWSALAVAVTVATGVG